MKTITRRYVFKKVEMLNNINCQRMLNILNNFGLFLNKVELITLIMPV